MFGHGLGGGPADWAPCVAAFADRFRVLTFAQAGSSTADPNLFSPARHSSPIGFADDLGVLLGEMGIRGAIYVGHSMAANAGAIAAAGDPDLFRAMILINGSPRYYDDPATDYRGGFTEPDVDEMLARMESDYESWAGGFGTQVMANADRPELALEFVRTLRLLDPQVAQTMFRAAFTADFRRLYPRITVPTLVLQSRDDPAVPMDVARWVAETIPGGVLTELRSAGHFPHVVDPDEVITAIDAFIANQAGVRDD